jgi:hypothetical protein
MSATSTVVTMLDGYVRDLRSLLDNVSHEFERGDVSSGLLGKVCLESARLVAYHRLFLLPTLSSVPDGGELVRSADERLDAVLAASRALETVDPGDAAQPLGKLAAVVDELGSATRANVHPVVERNVPAEVLTTSAVGSPARRKQDDALPPRCAQALRRDDVATPRLHRRCLRRLRRRGPHPRAGHRVTVLRAHVWTPRQRVRAPQRDSARDGTGRQSDGGRRRTSDHA